MAHNVLVFTTSHRLKVPSGTGCACAVSRCGCVRLISLPCIGVSSSRILFNSCWTEGVCPMR